MFASCGLILQSSEFIMKDKKISYLERTLGTRLGCLHPKIQDIIPIIRANWSTIGNTGKWDVIVTAEFVFAVVAIAILCYLVPFVGEWIIGGFGYLGRAIGAFFKGLIGI